MFNKLSERQQFSLGSLRKKGVGCGVICGGVQSPQAANERDGGFGDVTERGRLNREVCIE